MILKNLINRKNLPLGTFKLVTLLAVVTILILNIKFIKIYYNYLYDLILRINVEDNYFPAGNDIPYHILCTKEVITNPMNAIISFTHSYDHYPSIFHLLIALLQILTNSSFSNVFALYGILLLIVGPFLYSLVLMKLVPPNLNKYVVFLSILFIFIAFSLRIFHLLNDGNYPELTITLILIPILILFMAKYFETGKLIYFYFVPIIVAISINIELLGGVYTLLLYIIFIFVYLLSNHKTLKTAIQYAFNSFILLMLIWILTGPYRFLRFMKLFVYFIVNKSNLLPSAITYRPTINELSYYMFFSENAYFFFVLIIIISSFYYLILLVRGRITYREEILLIINSFALLLLFMTFFFSFLRIARYEALLLPLITFINVLVISTSIIQSSFSNNKIILNSFTIFLPILFLEVNIYTFTNLRVENISDVISISHRIDPSKYIVYEYLIEHYNNSTFLVIFPLDIWLGTFHERTKVLWPYPYVLDWVFFDDPKVTFYKNITEALLQAKFRELKIRYDVDLIVISLPYQSQWYPNFVPVFLSSLRNITNKVEISRLRIFLYSQLEPGDALISNIRIVNSSLLLDISKAFWVNLMKKYNNTNVVYVIGFPENTVLTFRKAEPYSIGEKLYSYVIKSDYTQIYINPGIYYTEIDLMIDNKHEEHSIELLIFIFPSSYNGEPLFTYVFVLNQTRAYSLETFYTALTTDQ